jgi:hypothetical protein
MLSLDIVDSLLQISQKALLIIKFASQALQLFSGLLPLWLDGGDLRRPLVTVLLESISLAVEKFLPLGAQLNQILYGSLNLLMKFIQDINNDSDL